MGSMERMEEWERVWGRFADAVAARRALTRASGAKRRAATMRIYRRWREMRDWCAANGVEIPEGLLREVT